MVFALIQVVLFFQQIFDVSEPENFNFLYFLRRSLQQISYIVDSNLFFSIFLSYESSYSRLNNQKIYSLDIQKLNEGARVSYLGFDKTGTLTDNQINFYGYLLHTQFEKKKIPKKIQIEDKKDSIMMDLLLGLTNSLILHKGEITGSQLDKILLERSKFELYNMKENERHFKLKSDHAEN